MSSSCRMSRGTCSNINKATPLSVIIFHRWQKEPNSNRFEGLCIIPLHISIHFSTLKSGKNRLEGWWASVRWWPRPGRIFFDIPSSRVEERNRIRVAWEKPPSISILNVSIFSSIFHATSETQNYKEIYIIFKRNNKNLPNLLTDEYQSYNYTRN